MQIHVIQEGEQFGPYSKAQLESYLWEGNVQRSDLAWVEGAEEWFPLWQVMGLPPQPGELPEEEVAEEFVAEPVAEIESAPLPVVEPVVEEWIPEAEPIPEEIVPAVSDLPEDVAAETPSVEEEPQPDDGRPKLIIPTAAPRRKLKLNVPGS